MEVGTVCRNTSRPHPLCLSSVPSHDFYRNFCSACAVTVVIFGLFNRGFFILLFTIRPASIFSLWPVSLVPLLDRSVYMNSLQYMHLRMQANVLQGGRVTVRLQGCCGAAPCWHFYASIMPQLTEKRGGVFGGVSRGCRLQRKFFELFSCKKNAGLYAFLLR